MLEVLWSAGQPLCTRQIHDAIARRYPHRAGRKINTTSSLLAALLEAGWVTGRKRGGTRWVYEPAVSRDERMRQLARRVVEAIRERPGDEWYVMWAALGSVESKARARRPATGGGWAAGTRRAEPWAAALN